MEGYFYRQFPHHFQETMACSNNTDVFSQSNSSAGTTGCRYHPYLNKTNYHRGHFIDLSGPSGSGSCYQSSACAYPGTYQQQQTHAKAWFSTMSMLRESQGDFNRHLAADITHLSTLKTLQEVCGLGEANARFTNGVWSHGNTISGSPQVTKTQAYEMQNEIKGDNFDHPFYNRRRRVAAPEEGMTRTHDKYRVVYNDKQRKGLEVAYEENKFITMETRNKLSKELELSDRQIKIWFQNRRAKERRDSKRSSAAESSSSDSDHSATSECIDRTSVTSSCRFDGLELEISNKTLQRDQCRYRTNSTNINQDLCLGYEAVPVMCDSQPFSSSGWINPVSHGGLRQLDTSPLGATIDVDFSTWRL